MMAKKSVFSIGRNRRSRSTGMRVLRQYSVRWRISTPDVRMGAGMTTRQPVNSSSGGAISNHWVVDERHNVVSRRSVPLGAINRLCICRGSSGRRSSCRWTPANAMRRIARRIASDQPGVNPIVSGRDIGEARHLRLAVDESVRHYHGERPHQGLGNEFIAPQTTTIGTGPMKGRERLGGLLKFYYREAA